MLWKWEGSITTRARDRGSIVDSSPVTKAEIMTRLSPGRQLRRGYQNDFSFLETTHQFPQKVIKSNLEKLLEDYHEGCWQLRDAGDLQSSGMLQWSSCRLIMPIMSARSCDWVELLMRLRSFQGRVCTVLQTRQLQRLCKSDKL